MLKVIPAWVLLMALLVYQFSASLYFGYFKLNQDYITVTYCVNKDKPEKECHGSCHMHKQLEQIQETKTARIPLSAPEYESTDIQFFTYETESINLTIPNSSNVHTGHELVGQELHGYGRLPYSPPEIG